MKRNLTNLVPAGVCIACLGLPGIIYFLMPTSRDAVAGLVPHFALLRFHLLNEIAIPYFTPAKCAGWVLAAHPKNLLFSTFTLLALLIPNAYTAVKLSHAIHTVAFGTGLYVWFRWFGVKNQIARLFAAVLISFSGYWITKTVSAGHVDVLYGSALAPWILVVIENLLSQEPKTRKRYVGLFVILTGLFVLLVNSVYWLWIVLPLLVARVVIEALCFRKNQARRVLTGFGVMLVSSVVAVLLSAPALAGVYEYSMQAFPRNAEHFQVIGDTRWLLEMVMRSFFDSGIVTENRHDGALGGNHEYSNFIGLWSLPLAAVGLFRLKNLFRSRAFGGLMIAAMFQLALVRTTHVADLARLLLPVLNSLTWYWRGSINLLLLYVFVVAAGVELLLANRQRVLALVCFSLMALNLGELGMVYNRAGLLVAEKPDFVSNTMNSEEYFSQPVFPHSSNSSWQMRCWDTLTGYRAEFYNSWAHGGPVYEEDGTMKRSHGGPVYEADGTINMVDIRVLFGAAGKGGYFKDHPWPLWPAGDGEQLEKFLNFEQIMPVPLRLQVINSLSAILWVAYLALALFLGVNRARSWQMNT